MHHPSLQCPRSDVPSTPPHDQWQQQASGGEQKEKAFGYRGIKLSHYGFEEVKAECEYAKP